MPFRTFDPQANFAVTRSNLPHWSQAQTLAFITWRTWDSIPANALKKWLVKRNTWLKLHGIKNSNCSLEVDLTKLAQPIQETYRRKMAAGWNRLLDQLQGQCVLRQPELARIVTDSLQHADEQQYAIYDYVVMPNHVHIIAVFPDENSQAKICRNWKHYTATKLNQALGRSGRFWQPESFDHLLRSESQFHRLRRYIADNPQLSHLTYLDCPHYSRPLI